MNLVHHTYHIGRFGIVWVSDKRSITWIPRRLTLKHNPAIYRWLKFQFGWDKRLGRD